MKDSNQGPAATATQGKKKKAVNTVPVHSDSLSDSKRTELDSRQYIPDPLYNLTPGVRRLLDRHLLKEESNPLCLLKRQIVDYVHQTYRKPGNQSPLFTICESEPRVVSTFQNFDSLLTPEDHVSRRSSNTYYVNRTHCLRAHTSAHQHNLMQQGLDAFLVIGDVYRRDEVDKTHYPCFHQIEGVRLYSKDDLLGKKSNGDNVAELFTSTADSKRVPEKQESHSLDATKATEIQLKQFLESLCDELFGKDAKKRWVDAYFPFTHPSYELEVFYNGQWLEVLGCGIMEQKLLESAGVTDKIGWAFGIGLERIAMVLYGIPDIRLFWSKDTGFLSQFAGKLPGEDVKYKQISAHPKSSPSHAEFDWDAENLNSSQEISFDDNPEDTDYLPPSRKSNKGAQVPVRKRAAGSTLPTSQSEEQQKEMKKEQNCVNAKNCVSRKNGKKDEMKTRIPALENNLRIVTDNNTNKEEEVKTVYDTLIYPVTENNSPFGTPTEIREHSEFAKDSAGEQVERDVNGMIMELKEIELSKKRSTVDEDEDAEVVVHKCPFPKCDRVFAGQKTLQNHQSIANHFVHLTTTGPIDETDRKERTTQKPAQIHKCPFPKCDRVFAGQKTLQNHQSIANHYVHLTTTGPIDETDRKERTTQKPAQIHKCPFPKCDRVFAGQKTLQNHQSIANHYVHLTTTGPNDETDRRKQTTQKPAQMALMASTSESGQTTGWQPPESCITLGGGKAAIDLNAPQTPPHHC